MERTPLPDDFDWVTARQKCSADKMFEFLYLAAKENAEKMRVSVDGRVSEPASLVVYGTTFSVLTTSYGDRNGVRFSLGDDEIAVVGFDNQIKLIATLTLNDHGECRLLVDGQELQPWQFLKRALEPLFFGGR